MPYIGMQQSKRVIPILLVAAASSLDGQYPVTSDLTPVPIRRMPQTGPTPTRVPPVAPEIQAAPHDAIVIPTISSVNDAADYSTVAAPGSLAVLFGTNLSTGTASAAAIPLPMVLAGASLTINGKTAPLLYVSAGQINFQIPYGTAPGTATAKVSNGSQTSSSFQFLVTSTSIGIFGYGAGHGIVQNADYSLNSPSNPAAAGSNIVVYLTGIGVPSLAVADGAAAPTTALANAKDANSATIGGMSAKVLFLGLTPGLVGLAQANLTVPNLATGDYPLTITLTGHESTSVVVSVKGATASGFQVLGALSQVSSVAVPGGTGTYLKANDDGLSGGSVVALGNYLYICGTSNINVVDISNPASPKIVYEFGDKELAGGAGYSRFFLGGCGLKTSGTSTLLTDTTNGNGTYVQTYDLTDPVHPKALSYVSDSTYIAGIRFSGDTGYMWEDHFTYSTSTYGIYQSVGYLAAVDFSTPSRPSILSYLQNDSSPSTDPTNMKFDLMVASPSVVYMAGTNSTGDPNTGTGILNVYDVSKPSNIQAITQMQVPGTGIELSLAASGNQMIALGSTKGMLSPGNNLGNSVVDFPLTGNLTLTVFDITTPSKPVMQGNFYFPTISADGCRATTLSKGFYALTCGAPDLSATGEGLNGSLRIVDMRDPTNPSSYTYGTLQGIGGLAVSNGYLFAATATGANIYKIQTP